jgi:hypothetical protein
LISLAAAGDAITARETEPAATARAKLAENKYFPIENMPDTPRIPLLF